MLFARGQVNNPKHQRRTKNNHKLIIKSKGMRRHQQTSTTAPPLQLLPGTQESGDGHSKKNDKKGSGYSLVEWQVYVLEVGNICKQIFDHALSSVSGIQLPNFSKQKVSSLCIQGSAAFTTGWSVRPQVPHQWQVACLIRSMPESFGGKGLELTPVFSFAPKKDVALQGSWKERRRRAKMSELKAARDRRLQV